MANYGDVVTGTGSFSGTASISLIILYTVPAGKWARVNIHYFLGVISSGNAPANLNIGSSLHQHPSNASGITGVIWQNNPQEMILVSGQTITITANALTTSASASGTFIEYPNP